MAATRFISMHTGKDKTPAAAEMLLARHLFLNNGGHQPPREKEVLAYHIRQAFKPGEISPEGPTGSAANWPSA